jgi:uncharacterized tellurite resistance protein B-like protein
MYDAKITPREAFLYLCLSMISADRDIDNREIEKLFEIVKRYGFKQSEVRKVADYILGLGTDQAFEYGLELVDEVKKLDKEMQNHLLHALLEIVEADQKVSDPELSFYAKIKNALKS